MGGVWRNTSPCRTAPDRGGYADAERYSWQSRLYSGRPPRPILVIRSPHKRKRRDRFPNLAASHAPSTSVRRTCRGARLATTPERAASDQWTARSPLATTILGARPFHAHGPFASNLSTGFPSSLPSREGVRCLDEDDLARHSRGPSAAFATARNLAVSLLHSVLSLARHTKLRETNHLPRRCHLQARESSARGGLAG